MTLAVQDPHGDDDVLDCCGEACQGFQVTILQWFDVFGLPDELTNYEFSQPNRCSEVLMASSTLSKKY